MPSRILFGPRVLVRRGVGFRGTNGESPLLLFNRVPSSELGAKHSQFHMTRIDL